MEWRRWYAEMAKHLFWALKYVTNSDTAERLNIPTPKCLGLAQNIIF